MGVFAKWLEKTDENKYSVDQINNYIREYYEKERDAYAKILASKNPKVTGTVAELAKEYKIETYEVAAFVDGINTSLETEINVDALEEDSAVELNIVWEKLLYNMYKAKASWLYELTEWDGILDADKRSEIKTQYHKDSQAVSTKINRNDPCPCGSGKKYKKCCGA